jgi:hypothetical protein
VEELQAILEAVDNGDLSGLTDEQLVEAADQIREYGKSLRKDKPTEDEINDAVTLADALNKVVAEIGVRDAKASELSTKADEAFAAFDDGGTPDDEDDEDEPAPVETVQASRPSAAEVAKRRPMSAQPKNDPKPKALVASAGTKEDSIGTAFSDLDELAAVMHSTWSQMRTGSGARTVARIPRENKYKLGADGVDNFEVLNRVMKESQEARNNGMALTAALGCAPSEPVYEFFNQSARGAGLVDLPSVTARRGSRTYPPAVAFTDIDGQTGIGTRFTGASKTCYTVNCGTTRTTDVVANFTCLTFDNEEGLFYPELVSHYGALSMIAHEHEVNQRLIENMRDAACTTEVHDLDTGGGTVIGLVRALLRVRAYYIQRHKMAENAVLDAVLPYWFSAAYATDIVTRQSTDMATSINLGLGRIESELRQGGINAMFVYDWQEGPVEGFDDFGSALLYAPGTFVRLDGPTLDLGVVRDSTLNAANDFQTFFESWTGLACVGNEAIYIQGIETCPIGQTALGSAVACGAS